LATFTEVTAPANSLLDSSENPTPPPCAFREPPVGASRKHVPNPILTRDLQSGRLVYPFGSRVREPPVHVATHGLLGSPLPRGPRLSPWVSINVVLTGIWLGISWLVRIAYPFKKVSGERMAQGVPLSRLGYIGCGHCALQRLLHHATGCARGLPMSRPSLDWRWDPSSPGPRA